MKDPGWSKAPRFKAMQLGACHIYDYDKYDIVQENGVFLTFPNFGQAKAYADELNAKDRIEKEELRKKEEALELARSQNIS